MPYTILKRIILLLSILYLTPSFSESDNRINQLQDSELKTYITNYAANHIPHQDTETLEVNITQLRQDFKLPACSSPIHIEMPNQIAATHANTVTLSCKDEPQWNIYVPINIKIFANVLVANRLIKTGAIISPEDVVYQKLDKHHLTDGYFMDTKDLIGLAANHSIQAGAVLNQKNTRRIPLITKNQTITLAVKTGAIEIQMIGIAKTDGFMNEPIKILNPSSKKIIDAIVTDKNKAEINF